MDPLGDFWESQGVLNEPFFAVLHSPGSQNGFKTSRNHTKAVEAAVKQAVKEEFVPLGTSMINATVFSV